MCSAISGPAESLGREKRQELLPSWSLLSVRWYKPKELREREVGDCAPGTGKFT